MNIETPVEYYYGETLRWSFGFDNPNKAAVLFACAVPLIWWLWQASWRIHPRWARLPALVVAATLLVGAWFCLIMTFSRGGLVATAAALLYQTGAAAWLGRKSAAAWPIAARVWVSVLLAGGLLGGTLWNGLGSRSVEALGNDASVGNRIELWGSALQMAVDNPRGFGSGKSGEQYMQWYQPLDRQQGYRTMVNSYLTFLVELGWCWTFLIALGFSFFWVWTQPGGAESLPLALRASILGFLVAGFFSTTMEEWRLWVMPAAAAIALGGMALWRKRSMAGKPMLFAGGGAALACAGLWCAGWQKSKHDPLRREFGETNGGRSIIAVGPKNSTSLTLGCVVDEAVLGDQSAKLLRELALNADVTIMLGERAPDAGRILCMGQGVQDCSNYPDKPLLLLAPERIQPAELAALAQRTTPVQILMPEIDEDGRVGFWNDITSGELADHFQLTALSGVGNRVDWAWAQVVELVKDGNLNP
jgi:hypothetical protein